MRRSLFAREAQGGPPSRRGPGLSPRVRFEPTPGRSARYPPRPPRTVDHPGFRTRCNQVKQRMEKKQKTPQSAPCVWAKTMIDWLEFSFESSFGWAKHMCSFIHYYCDCVGIDVN